MAVLINSLVKPCDGAVVLIVRERLHPRLGPVGPTPSGTATTGFRYFAVVPGGRELILERGAVLACRTTADG